MLRVITSPWTCQNCRIDSSYLFLPSPVKRTMELTLGLLSFLFSLGLNAGVLASQDASNNAVVDLSIKRGTPQHLAAGFIYGIPDTLNQMPDHLYLYW